MTNRSRWFSAARSLVVGVLSLLLAACESWKEEDGQESGGVDAGHESSGSSSVSGTSGGGMASAGGGVGPGGATTDGNGAGASGGATGTGGAAAGTGGAAVGVGTGDAAAGTDGAAAGTGGATGGAVGSDGGSGAVGTSGDGGGSGEAGAADSADAGTGACKRGQVAGNEVLIVGDSYFALSGDITRELRRLSGADYRDVSVSGTKMDAIARSYTRNRTPQPKVVIMDGGGNDILQNPFCATGCAQHVQAITNARNFFLQMAMDGVEDVVFVFYYDMPAMKEGLDWMRPRMAAECQQSPVPCHFVDNQPLFAGQDASAYTLEGIHPNRAASNLIAKQIWDRMTQECIAQ